MFKQHPITKRYFKSSRYCLVELSFKPSVITDGFIYATPDQLNFVVIGVLLTHFIVTPTMIVGLDF